MGVLPQVLKAVLADCTAASKSLVSESGTVESSSPLMGEITSNVSVELLSINFPWIKFPWQKSIIHFTRLLGAAHLENIKGAEAELKKLKQLPTQFYSCG